MSKNVVTLKSGSEVFQGHLKVVLFDRLGMVSYWCSILTLSLKRTIVEIFDFENVVTLKSMSKVTQGHRNRHGSIRYL